MVMVMVIASGGGSLKRKRSHEEEEEWAVMASGHEEEEEEEPWAVTASGHEEEEETESGGGEIKVFSGAFMRKCSTTYFYSDAAGDNSQRKKTTTKTAGSLALVAGGSRRLQGRRGVSAGKRKERHGAHAAAAIPGDLISEMLVRLPAKLLGRFRCISKQWLSLTTNPTFVYAHAALAPISGFIPDPMQYADHIPFDDPSHLNCLADPSFPPRKHLRGGAPFSCCGLLLHHGFRHDEEDNLLHHWFRHDGDDNLLHHGLQHDEDDNLLHHGFPQDNCGSDLRRWTRLHDDDQCGIKTFYICNPMTKQLLFIPRPMLGLVFGYGLASDPLEPFRFKVVTWERESKTRCDRLHMYSFTTQSWKVLHEVNYEESEDCMGREAVFWNGTLAWPYQKDSFLLLDVKEEKVSKVAQPKLPCICLCESKGRLYFIGEVDGMDMIDILEMESESTGWSVLYHHLDLRVIQKLYPECDWLSSTFVCFVRGGFREEDELILLLDLYCSGKYVNKVISFHPHSKMCSTVVDRTPAKVGIGGVTPHAHSLISL